MGQFLALSITDLLTKFGMTGIPVIVGLIFLDGLLTLFISSGSAIWSILAPIYALDDVYRISSCFYPDDLPCCDSSLILLAPLSAFTPLFLKYLQEYKKDARLEPIFQ